MGFWDVIKKVQDVGGVVLPIAEALDPGLIPYDSVIRAALALVNATHNGVIDPNALAQLNLLLQPHGLVVLQIPKALV